MKTTQNGLWENPKAAGSQPDAVRREASWTAVTESEESPLYFVSWLDERIPKGFRRTAQGCDEGATLGHHPTNLPNRNAVAATSFRSGTRVTLAATPLGLMSSWPPRPRVARACLRRVRCGRQASLG